MNSKSLLIAIAAFAVTTTGAQAFTSTTFLSRSGLDDTQIEAFTEARELRLKGKNDEARDVLFKAGIDEKTLNSLRVTAGETHRAIEKAIVNRDFEAFKQAITGTPLYDIVTTKEDFSLFVEAHDLKLAGKVVEAQTILNDLGVNSYGSQNHFRHGRKFHTQIPTDNLSGAEQDALRVARQANDNKTVERILTEAGVIDKWTKAGKEWKTKFRGHK